MRSFYGGRQIQFNETLVHALKFSGVSKQKQKKRVYLPWNSFLLILGILSALETILAWHDAGEWSSRKCVGYYLFNLRWLQPIFYVVDWLPSFILESFFFFLQYYFLKTSGTTNCVSQFLFGVLEVKQHNLKAILCVNNIKQGTKWSTVTYPIKIYCNIFRQLYEHIHKSKTP